MDVVILLNKMNLNCTCVLGLTMIMRRLPIFRDILQASQETFVGATIPGKYLFDMLLDPEYLN